MTFLLPPGIKGLIVAAKLSALDASGSPVYTSEKFKEVSKQTGSSFLVKFKLVRDLLIDVHCIKNEVFQKGVLQ